MTMQPSNAAGNSCNPATESDEPPSYRDGSSEKANLKPERGFMFEKLAKNPNVIQLPLETVREVEN